MAYIKDQTYHLRNNTALQRVLASFIFLLAAAALMISFPAEVYAAEGSNADVNGAVNAGGVAGGAYEVTDYDYNAVINRNHSYDVEIKITVNIPDTLQSISFAVPSGNFRIRGLEAVDISSVSELASEGSTITITDPEQLTSGIHTYTIRYNILEFADRDETEDMLYFYALLPEWSQPIGRISIKASFPEDFPWDDIQYYAGQFGVQDTENRLTFKASEAERTVTITGEKIPENFGIAIKSELPDGYWEGALDGIWAAFAMVFVMGLAAFIQMIMWLIAGRDPKVPRQQITMPDILPSPAELGYVFNSELGIRDVVRLIFTFAINGNLRIIEYEPKRYRLQRLKDPEGEERLIRNAYSILFEDVYEGRYLEMEDMGVRLFRMENSLRDDVASGYQSPEMLAYTPLSKAFRIAGVILTAAAFASVNAFRYLYQYISVNIGETVIIGVLAAVILTFLCAIDDSKYSSYNDRWRTGELICIALLTLLAMYVSIAVIRSTGQYPAAALTFILTGVSVFFTVIMRARGKGNAELVMKLRQLRRFINKPDPGIMLANYLSDKNYYYRMMIYALTFGSEEAWAISFLTLDVPEPDWYRDEIEGHAFTNIRERAATIDYARDFRSFIRTVENAYQSEYGRRSRSFM